MKKLLLIVLSFMTLSVYGQRHYFTNNPDEIAELFSADYVYSGLYEVYYKEFQNDEFKFVCNQEAAITVHDFLGYYDLIFIYPNGTAEVYEFEYRYVEWRGTEMQIMCLPAKDFLGVEVATLGIWEEELCTSIILLWTDKSLYDTMLYFIRYEKE